MLPETDVLSVDGSLVSQVTLPPVFGASIRSDLVNFVHYNMARNSRQAYGVATNAGYQTSAESWGTGRAVARIPRVPGGGTHRAGQGAFGNMCRGGGMFAPLKTWRRWHRKINVTQKRHALTSAIAASSYTALVMGRGHRIEKVRKMPIVVEDTLESLKRTKDAVKTLKSLGCGEDLTRVILSKKIRAGRGKCRNRRYTMRRGPLIIFNNDDGLRRAFRNIPGVELCHVERLNLLQMAPGGTMGRLVVWSKSAFERLTSLYGSTAAGSSCKSGYVLARPMMGNLDFASIVNSHSAVMRPALMPKFDNQKFENRNPYRSYSLMKKLYSPYNNIKRHIPTPKEKKEKLVQRKIAKKLYNQGSFIATKA